MKQKQTILLSLLVACSSLTAAINVTPDQLFYVQDFNTLPSTGTELIWNNNETIPGWYRDYFAATEEHEPPFRDRSVQGADVGNGGIGAEDGFMNIGFDGSTDRTIVLRRGFTLYGAVGAVFQNNTGSSIVGFEAGYTGEQWRRQGDGFPTSLYFEYAVLPSVEDLEIASDPENWIRVDSLTFTSPNINGANTGLNGKLQANRAVLDSVLVETNVPNGQYLVIRWYQSRPGEGVPEAVARHGLGINEMNVLMITGETEEPEESLWEEFPMVGEWRLFDTTLLYDENYPYIYHPTMGWLYVFPDSSLDDLYFYSFTEEIVGWFHSGLKWYYDLSAEEWIPVP